MQLHLLHESTLMESFRKALVVSPVKRGGDKARGYRKHPQTSLKYFCEVCGVRTHELGSADYMGGDFVGIFISTLDNVEPAELIAAPVSHADGRNNNWQNPPAETRHL